MPGLHRPPGVGSAATLGARAGYGANERLLEIKQEIVRRFEADGETDQIRGSGKGGVCCRGMRHSRGQLDQALDAPERLGELEQLRAGDERPGFRLRLDREGDHPLEVIHMSRRCLVARMAWPAQIVRLSDTLHP